MDNYIKTLDIRWSDLDPNFHVLHSKYYDFGAYCRMAFLQDAGITPDLMRKNHIGPILFREECFFKKELLFGEKISISLVLTKRSENYSRWSMEHEIHKKDGVLAARIVIDAAWMDTAHRKLTIPSPEIISLLDIVPKSPSFHIGT